MGPLASAEFVRTIYELNVSEMEQDSPQCVLLSDPTIPDRTDAIRNGTEAHVAQRLALALENLYRIGATKVVIPCMTMHHFLPRVAVHLRRNVISLVDVVIESLSNTDGRHILFASTGVRNTGLFENHRLWSKVEPKVVLPTDDEQRRLHSLIYQHIKTNPTNEAVYAFLDELSEHHQTDSFIAGCSEVHLLNRHIMNGGTTNRPFRFIDPLLTIAQDLRRFMHA